MLASNENITVDAPSLNIVGKQTVQIKYTYNGGLSTLTTSYDVDVVSLAIESIQIYRLPNKTVYDQYDEIDLTGMVVQAVMNNGTIETVSINVANVVYDFSVSGQRQVTVQYNGFTASFNVTVNEVNYYTVTWNMDGQITTERYAAGAIPMYSGKTEKASDEENSYVFIGWSPEVTAVNGDVTYTAQFQTVPYAKLMVENKNVIAGDTVIVKISLANNPGISSMKLVLSFDENALQLTNIEYNSEIGGQSQQPQTKASPVTLNWFNGAANTNGDFVFATLTFKVADTVTAGESYTISVAYDQDDLFNIDYEDVIVNVSNGVITVINHIPGDVNGDGKVNNKDLSLLFQYLSGWDVKVEESALDVNGDGKVNNKDLSLLFQYLSGWVVEIF
jgi:hypothetical protein